MPAIARFIRDNPERARSLENITNYIPYLLADGRSLIQSQLALTVSRVASLGIGVCLHDNAPIQKHIENLRRELDARHSSLSLLPSSRSTSRAGSPAGGGATYSGSNNDTEGEEPAPEASVASLESKYNDPQSRALTGHYKRTVAAELIIQFLNEVEVLTELCLRSTNFQSLIASHGCGACLSDSAVIKGSKGGPKVTGFIRHAAGNAPIPPRQELYKRSRRTGWIVCWTLALIKSVLRLYVQRSTLTAAMKSLLAQVQTAVERFASLFKRLKTKNERPRITSSREGSPAPNICGGAAGRAPSTGLVIPRVVSGSPASSHSPSRRRDTAADCAVYTFSLKEYLATIIDAFHAARPFIWTVIACLYRTPSTKAPALQALLSHEGGVAMVGAHSIQPTFAAISRSVPRLFLPSWRGWLLMAGLELTAFTGGVYLQWARDPVVFVGRRAQVPEGTIEFVSSKALSAEKDRLRVSIAARNIALSTLLDPFFAVVLKAWVVDKFVEGGVARLPIIGGIIGAQTMMFLTRRETSFLASNF